MKPRIVGLMLAAAVVCGAATARADVITITGGAWNEVGNIDGGGMTLVSDRFNISSAWDCTPPWCNFPSLMPGSTVGLSTNTNADHLGGGGTVDGVTGLYGWDSTQMTFTVAPVTIPASTPPNTRVTVSVPFTMTGLLTLESGQQTLLSDPIAGSGHLQLVLFSTANGTYALDGLGTTFRFESSAAPTPEPATTALLALGFAAAGVTRYRRRR